MRVFWPKEDKYYPGLVTSYEAQIDRHKASERAAREGGSDQIRFGRDRELRLGPFGPRPLLSPGGCGVRIEAMREVPLCH